MKTVDKTLTISEQLSEFIDLSDAELKRVTGGWGHGHGHGGHNSCDWGGHNSCDWGGHGGHDSCDWGSHGGHSSCWG